MKAPHLRSGDSAERQALSWLRKQGLKLIEQNYRCKNGEIDLIMQDDQTLVFVEVRYRSHGGFGSAAESVTPVKQRKLLRTAAHYLQRQNTLPPCRFDIIGMDGDGRIKWLRNAIQQ